MGSEILGPEVRLDLNQPACQASSRVVTDEHFAQQVPSDLERVPLEEADWKNGLDLVEFAS